MMEIEISKKEALKIVDKVGAFPDKKIWQWVQKNQDVVLWVILGNRSTNVQINYAGYQEDFDNDNGSNDPTEGTGFYLEHCIGCSEGVTILLDAMCIKWTT